MPRAKQKRKPRNLTEFPADWTLGDAERAIFRKESPTATDADIERQWRKFKFHHLSRGSEFKLWSAAWGTWVMNAEQYGFHPTGGIAPVPIGAVARSTWLRPKGGDVNEARGLQANAHIASPAVVTSDGGRTTSPEEQQAHVRSLIAGIGNAGRGR